MTLGLNSHSCGSGIGWFRAARRVIRGLACRSGLALTLGLAGCSGKVEPQVQYVRVEAPVQVPCRAPEWRCRHGQLPACVRPTAWK